MKESCRSVFLLFMLMGCFACTSPKKEEKEVKRHVEAQALGVSEEGRPLYAPCKACHGDYGQGNQKLNAPALVNIDDWYLYRQLMNFRNGIRGYHPADTLGAQMVMMSRMLQDSTAVSNVVAFLESLPEAPIQNTLKGDIKKGERIYQSVCGSCHGPQGKGNKAMNAPRLNGLDDWYLKRQVLNFKDSRRGTHQKDLYGAQMVPMATLLKDDQSIDDVIVYIRSATVPGGQ